MAQPLNYAVNYSRELANAFPYVLNFGALYATPNNGRYRWANAKAIEIPSVTTTGRVNSNRDNISFAARNYDNAWELKPLKNQREWSTLVHPMDIDQTNLTTTIGNITQAFNEQQKFPEMDAYCVSKIYADWVALGNVADTTPITIDNVLEVFDQLMLNMDNARVPVQGRILYVTNEVKKIISNADKIYRTINVESALDRINRTVNRLDEVQIVGVPANLMRTAYIFDEGWAVAPTSLQINMFLVHPNVVITPVSYTFSRLDEPSAGSKGKYIYYEESFEDVFILNNRAGGIQFNITSSTPSGLGVEGAPADLDFWGTTPSQFQSGVTVLGNNVVGSLTKLTSGQLVTNWGEGYFLAMSLADNSFTGYTSVKIGLDPTAGSGLQEIINDPDKAGVFKITNKDLQKFVVESTKDGITKRQVYNLSNLTIVS